MAGKQQKDVQYIVRELLKYIPEAEIIQTTKYILKQNEYQEDVSFEAKSRLSITQQNIENFANMSKAKETLLEGKADKLKDDVNNLFEILKPIYRVGDYIQEIHDIQALDIETKTSKPTSWLPKAGVITLAYFWSIENYKSWSNMGFNECLLYQHEDWIDRVELSIFCLNSQSEKMIKDIRQLTNGTQMKHYYFTNGWNDYTTTINSMNLTHKCQDNLPLAVLFNQQGQIVSIEQFNYAALEKKIQQLLDTPEQQIINQQMEQYQQILCQSQLQQETQSEQYTLINNADFKILKGKIRGDVQQFLKGLRFRNSTVEILIVKTNRVSSISKIPLQRTKAIIDYNVQNDEKAKLDEFLKLIQDILPAEMISFGSTVIFDDPQFRQILQDVCKNNGVQVQYLNKRISNYKFVNSDQPLKLEIISEDAIKVQQTNSTIVDNIFTQLENSLSSAQYKQFAISYNPVKRKIIYAIKLGINDKYIPIESYLKVETQVIETIFHKQGQILVICYYEFQNSSTTPLIPINTMLKQNKAIWGDNVRIVVLSKYQFYQKFLKITKQLNELEFYEQVKDYPRDHLLYNVGWGSRCVIVDAEGLVQHIGSFTLLEENISNMLHLQEQIKPIKISNEQVEQLARFLDQSKDAFKDFGNERFFEFELQFKAIYENEYEDAKFIKANQPTLKYWIRQDKVEQFNKVLSQLYEIVPKEQFMLTETISKAFDVPFPGQQCVVCKGVLTDQVPQYYSPFKNEFVCAPCAEFDDKTKIGLARFKYTDTLIFINAPLTDLSQLKEIDGFKIGKNQKLPIGEVGKQKHKIRCKKCVLGRVGIRYISLSAWRGKLQKERWGSEELYYDICQKCFNILRNKNSEETVKFFKRKGKNGISPDGLFVRILFNTGYHEF